MEVGVRELRNHLGAYLKRVRSGETIVVRARGKPIARLEPVPGLPAHLEKLWREGKVHWSGQRPRIGPGVRMTPGDSIVEKIMAERERDFW